jgi:predicted transcriptional regulator
MKLIFIVLCLFSFGSKASLPRIVLQGDNGETLEGKAFDSNSLKGKVTLLVHIDPDAKNLNQHVDKALMKAKLDSPNFASVAVINVVSTWIPRGILKMALRVKKKEFPKTVYVLDYAKTFVEKWNVLDHSSSYLLFNPKGSVIFRKDGKLSVKDVGRLLKALQKNLSFKG